jgi:hypothetical protein
MKHLYLWALAFFLVLSPAVSMAQESPSGEAVIATTNIQKVEILEQDGKGATISVTLSNGTGVQPGLRYVLDLYQERTIVDTQVYGDVFSIGENESLQK